jgi:hypothetical protein
MMANRCVCDSKAIAQRDRLGEVTRGHPHLVAIRAQALNHGPHHEHVRAVRQVNPDTHLAAR